MVVGLARVSSALRSRIVANQGPPEDVPVLTMCHKGRCCKRSGWGKHVVETGVDAVLAFAA